MEKKEGVNLLILELEKWLNLRHSGELQALYRIFKSHKDYLNKNALKHLEGIDILEGAKIKAIVERAKALDMEKLVDLIENRIKECGKEE